jgi:hypothetical protein
MMAYETGAQTDAILKAFAADILKKIGDPGPFPAAVRMLPKTGLTADSEKYILKNFLGQEFLKNGTIASYKRDGAEPDAFIVETAGDAESEALLKKYTDTAKAKGLAVDAVGSLTRIKDPYLFNVLVGRAGRFLFGVTKVKDPALAVGEKLAAELSAALKQ